jgi:PAS domain S-box-containing protein
MIASEYREELYAVFADGEETVEGQIVEALEIGTDYLGVSVGFVTRITEGEQKIVITSGDHGSIQEGKTCPLNRAYCQRTVETDGLLSVQDAAASAAIPDIAFDAFGLGCYIGVKVLVDDELFGTVCFADTDTREAPFDEPEELFVELLARLIGTALERREHERDLQERNARLLQEKQRFQGIIENSSDVIFRIDEHGAFTYVSPAVEGILGYERDEFVGEPLTTFMTDSSAERATQSYRDTMHGEASHGLELEFVGNDGDTVVLEVNTTPITDDGEIVGSQGVGRDITERKRRERELELKNRAMDESNVGISIADIQQPDDPIMYVNDGFERLTGYDESEVIGRNCRFLQGDTTADETIDTIREAIENRTGTTVEILNYRKDGSPFWNQLRISPVTNENGPVTYYIGLQEDITDRKRSEQLFQLLNRVLRHNLRNDMNVIMGSATELTAEDQEPAIREIGNRIDRLATELFDMSHKARLLERHARQDRQPERVDLAEVIDDVAIEYREAHPGATIHRHTSETPDICAGAEIEEAISELVDNAITYNQSSTPTVSITTERDGEWTEIVVRDDGPGIDDMESAVISAGEETPLEHGAGLGLWLVNWIVTRYGGSFKIAGDPEEGTTATIRMPALPAHATVQETSRPPTVLFS